MQIKVYSSGELDSNLTFTVQYFQYNDSCKMNIYFQKKRYAVV